MFYKSQLINALKPEQTSVSAIDPAVIAAVIAAIVSIIIGYIVYKDNRKGRVGTVISTNRVEWIQLLKSHIANYLNEVNKFDLIHEKNNYRFMTEEAYKEDYAQYQDSLGAIFHAFCTIRLHLNYKGKPDNELIKLCQYIYNIIFYFVYNKKEVIGDEDVDLIEALKNKDLDERNELIELIEPSLYEANIEDISYSSQLRLSSYLLTLLSQIYLKTEWKRVKYEVKYGNSKNFDFDMKYNKSKGEQEVFSEIQKIVSVLNLTSIISIDGKY